MTITVLKNGAIFNGIDDDVIEGYSIVIEDGVIREVSDRAVSPSGANVIDVNGKVVMPGLIDAHFHAYASKVNIGLVDTMPAALRVAHAARILEQTLQRGYTTVRDAAGGDIGLKMAIDQGLIQGPRFYFPGLAVSQSGGHGDMRAPDHEPLCTCNYCGAFSMVADGPDEVRKAVREQLRKGATQIKIFVSGGVISPSDPIWMNQMTEEEIRTAVAEAGTRGSYVMAHAHTAEAVQRCVRNGVKSIEHATILTADAAAEIARFDAFAVPTLVTLKMLVECGKDFGLSPVQLGKAAEVERHALSSLALLQAAGAKVGFGTDLLGEMMPHQSREFTLRREVMSAVDILRSATSVNAALLGERGRLGTIAANAAADILVVDGNPLINIEIMQETRRLQVIMKAGKIVKNTLP